MSADTVSPIPRDNKYVLDKLGSLETMLWYEEYWVPLEGLILIAGAPDTGKSTLFAHLIGKFTTGGFKGHDPVDVLYMFSEDTDSRIRGRAIAAGADINKIHTFRIKDEEALSITEAPITRQANLKDDLVELGYAINDHPEIKIIFMEPAPTFLGVDDDKDSKDTVRRAVENLQAFALQHHILIVGMKHIKKKQANSHGIPLVDQIYGSTGWIEVCRNIQMLCTIDSKLQDDIDALEAETSDDEKANTLLVNVKNNYAPKNLPAKGFRLEGAEVTEGDITDKTVVIKYVGPRDLTKDQIQTSNSESTGEKKERKENGSRTITWLTELLQSNDGQLPAKDIRELASKESISRSMLDLAMKKMRIESVKVEGSKTNEKIWKLPNELFNF